MPWWFVQKVTDLAGAIRSAFVRACVHCHRVGYLVGHGLHRGYIDASSERVVRGHRVLCSKRGRARGCGRTTMVRVAAFVQGLVVSARTLLQLASLLTTGMCCAEAWRQCCSMSVSSGYRSARRLALAQAHLRTALCARAPPPEHAGAHPLGHTLAHLGAALGEHASFEMFQLVMQVGLFG